MSDSRALEAWLAAAARGRDDVAACTAAAESVADDPWAVVTQAGALARARRATATEDLGLTEALAVRHVDAAGVVCQIAAGAPYPAFDRPGRQRAGAFDTPAATVHRVVAGARAAARGAVRIARDPACGSGAFLIALAEAGVPEREGVELDPRAAAVARIADPGACIVHGDGLVPRAPLDLVVGNPPFVPPERQDRDLRKRLRARYPWMSGRFDLAVPFAVVALEGLRAGGGAGLVLPASLLWQNYARSWRQRILQTHAITLLSGPESFPGAAVEVCLLGLCAGGGPAHLPGGLAAAECLSLPNVPLHPALRPGDAALVAHVRARSVELATLAEVDTGVVSHGPDGGKARLLHDEPGPGRVPYVDAADLQRGRTRWLAYTPERMHRAKRPELFENPKLLVQRLRGKGPIRVWLDRTGLYAGHTLTVVRPLGDVPPLEKLASLLQAPEVDGLLRLERGQRLDLYPRDLAELPVPRAWLDGQAAPLAQAWALDPTQVARLRAWAHNSPSSSPSKED